MYYNFPVGTLVGVVKDGHPQGLYAVTKCNGNVIEIVRQSDGYARTFSNRTGREKMGGYNRPRYYSASIVTREQIDELEVAISKGKELNDAWGALSACSRARDLSKAIEAVEELKRLHNR